VNARLENVSLSFGEKRVLEGLDLTIVEGAVTCLVGLSGAGKSTVLRLLNGLRRPSSGRVFVDEIDIAGFRQRELVRLRRRIGFAFQFSALFDSLTIYDNVALPLREYGGVTEREVREQVEPLLATVGLEGSANALPAELSGGMLKRAGFARAVIAHPDLVLYDEPTTGLDPIITNLLTRIIRSLQQRDKSTAVVVSHDIASVYEMADYIAMLYNGKIIAYGTVAEIRGSADPFVIQFVRGEIEGPIRVG
jgi:phospholipid/cholesterol/gamma-HCH transport system ATP-binding protein